LVLWPKYLLGGMLQREGGLGGLERGEGEILASGLRGLAGRLPDAEVLLQGAMSEGLRDWDLWYTPSQMILDVNVTNLDRGPLAFSLLLSLLLSITASSKQREVVFTGVFGLVWLGSVIVTWQIRLLGGKMYDHVLVRQGLMLTTTPAPSSRLFVLLAIPYSLSSLRRSSVQSTCKRFLAYPSTSF
jgi:hypothetical protein